MLSKVLKSFYAIVLFSFFVLMGCGGDSKEQPKDMDEKETASSDEQIGIDGRCYVQNDGR